VQLQAALLLLLLEDSSSAVPVLCLQSCTQGQRHVASIAALSAAAAHSLCFMPSKHLHVSRVAIDSPVYCCMLVAVAQVYVSTDFWQTSNAANIGGGAPRAWAAVSISAGGSTIAAVSATEDAMRRIAARTLGARISRTAETLLKQARRAAPAQAAQYQTVWISKDSGASWFPTTPTPSASSYFADVALSAAGNFLVAVQRGSVTSANSGIYTGSVGSTSVTWSAPTNMGVDEW
jgi:hypothetical protein